MVTISLMANHAVLCLDEAVSYSWSANETVEIGASDPEHRMRM